MSIDTLPGVDRSPEISLRNFLYVVFKRRWQVVRFFVGTVALVAVVSLLLPPTYQANAKVLVKIGRENIYVPTVPSKEQLNAVFAPNHEDQINSEIEILKSDYLARRVVETIGPLVMYPDLNSGITSFLTKLFSGVPPTQEQLVQKAMYRLQQYDLQVNGVRQTDTIDVIYGHRDPNMAAKVVNTLVSLYLEQHLQVHQSPQSYAFYRDQSLMLQKNLDRAESNLESFMKQNAISSPDEERSLLLKQQADIRAELNQTLSQEAQIESRLAQFRRQLTSIPKTIPVDEELDHSPTVIAPLQAQLVELEVKERELLGKYSDQSRLVQNVRDEIGLLRSRLAEQDHKRFSKSRSGSNPLYQNFVAEIARGQVELQAVQARKAIQIAQATAYQDRLEKLNRAGIEFNDLKQQVENERHNYQLYSTKLEEARISNAMDVERISNVGLIDSARPPAYPVSPKIFLNLIVSVILGLVGGVGIAFLREHFDDSLEKDEDIETHLQLPVLASVTEFC
jgi:protein tyrosine kinase modulator